MQQRTAMRPAFFVSLSLALHDSSAVMQLRAKLMGDIESIAIGEIYIQSNLFWPEPF
jgi:hypothetical protein